MIGSATTRLIQQLERLHIRRVHITRQIQQHVRDLETIELEEQRILQSIEAADPANVATEGANDPPFVDADQQAQPANEQSSDTDEEEDEEEAKVVPDAPQLHGFRVGDRVIINNRTRVQINRPNDPDDRLAVVTRLDNHRTGPRIHILTNNGYNMWRIPRNLTHTEVGQQEQL